MIVINFGKGYKTSDFPLGSLELSIPLCFLLAFSGQRKYDITGNKVRKY